MAICVVVNGPSSVGKSTLVEGLQGLASVPLLRFGADELYGMVPAQWTGGTVGASHGEQGFSYREVLSEHGLPIGRRIHNGPDAVRMLHAMNAEVLGMVTAGHDVIVDGEAYEPQINADLHVKLRHAADRDEAQCNIVELTADTKDLLDRQQRHAHPAGLAESQSRQGWIGPGCFCRWGLDAHGVRGGGGVVNSDFV